MTKERRKKAKSVSQLAFAALLFWFILSWPKLVRADYQVGPYLCSSDFQTCQNSATQYISQCMTDCFDTGNDGTHEQYCYNEAEVNAYDNGGNSYIVTIDWTRRPVIVFRRKVQPALKHASPTTRTR